MPVVLNKWIDDNFGPCIAFRAMRIWKGPVAALFYIGIGGVIAAEVDKLKTVGISFYFPMDKVGFFSPDFFNLPERIQEDLAVVFSERVDKAQWYQQCYCYL